MVTKNSCVNTSGCLLMIEELARSRMLSFWMSVLLHSHRSAINLKHPSLAAITRCGTDCKQMIIYY